MKKYLLWKTSEEQLQSPLLAAQAPDEPHHASFLQLPTITADQADYRLTTGSTLSAAEQPSSQFVVRSDLTAAYPGAGLSAYPSAFSAVGSPAAVAAASSAAAAAAAAAAGQLCFAPMSPGLINHYGSLMCSPVLLDRLGPHILRSHVSTAQFKPIPNNERVDLDRFRLKEPQEWGMDDVVAWMIAIARRHQIAVEDMNIHKFASCTGPLLLLMSEQHFVDRDAQFGSMLYREFRKLVSDDNSFLDDWMRAYKEESGFTDDQQPSTSRQGVQHTSIHMGRPALASASSSHHPHLLQQPGTSAAISSVAPPKSVGIGAKFHGKGPPAVDAVDRLKLEGGAGARTEEGDRALHGVNLKIRKNKDGKPRKRSQHTKGNKLWEFIRDALKDANTCPSVVRWEDPVEGVFRIVESEKLARLWGDKKNNQKMTYEKLSRAMRTYYEKLILVPVPKTGLYPKKLVYKFGPNAHGWSTLPGAVMASSNVKDEPEDDDDDDDDDMDRNNSPMPDTPPALQQYYYNTKILLPVSGRRLVYKFGPSAQGWRDGGVGVAQSQPSRPAASSSAFPLGQQSSHALFDFGRPPLFVDQLLSTVVARKMTEELGELDDDDGCDPDDDEEGFDDDMTFPSDVVGLSFADANS
uniref:ETS domain-containing protein n=1 Tax=Plectus sambesii TaxID=2011161 RepID=A0A914XRF8_9BILA